MAELASEPAARLGTPSAVEPSLGAVDTLRAIALGLTVVTTLIVTPTWGYGNEAYTVGKTLSLALMAAIGAVTLFRLEKLRITIADGLLGLYWLHGVVSACVGTQPLSMASVALLPELSAGLVMATLVVGTEKSVARRGIVLDVLVVSATLMSLIALAEALGVALPWQGMRRPHSTLGNRNFVGAEAAIVAFIAYGRFVARPSTWRAVSLAALVAAVGISRCRSAWLGSLLAVAAVAASAWLLRRASGRGLPAGGARHVGAAAAVTVLALAAVAFMPWPGLRWTDTTSPISDTLGRVTEYKTGTGRERLGDLGIAATLATQHPLFGVGPRGWDEASTAIAHQMAGRHATPQHFWTTPNSDLARTLGERGIVGASLLLAALIALLDGAVRAARSRSYLENLMLVGALTVFGVNAVLDAPLFRPSSLLLAAVLFGLLRSSAGGRVIRLRRTAWSGALAVVVTLLLTATTLRAAAAKTACATDDLDALRRAQELFWRPDVAEVLSLKLARAGQCSEAESVGLEALAVSPHHWGVPHALAACWGARGEHERARRFTEQRDAIEPHVAQLFTEHADVPSGYEARAR